ncbi:hypothetical protein [Polynucleobacter sp. es-MAR-4]|uniref:hypothetical protein n=1 Tax=Polynucleobacter sp. es-MAR-4 TaxID=1855655 RepID=UPI001C0C321E|nr:hypothetical protein [Polynucleobacter sp. es-MAR-4]MBU3637357.1 hypothetical protein [Polynucleobacter sp. es-MAR-4]
MNNLFNHMSTHNARRVFTAQFYESEIAFIDSCTGSAEPEDIAHYLTEMNCYLGWVHEGYDFIAESAELATPEAQAELNANAPVRLRA